MPELSIGERLIYSTVKLTASRGGVATSTGTGFFFAFCRNGASRALTIVTNKHVVEGNDEVIAILHINANGQPSGNFAKLHIALEAQSVVPHPDPNIDLCAIFIGDFLHQAIEAGQEFFLSELGIEHIPQANDWQYFDAMEEVTMLGCPNGISDEVNNLPIARRGITATHLSKDYNGQRQFMVDMACFPGSSGSPIFIYDRNGFLDRRTNNYMMGQTRALLVGILFAGPQITNTGTVVLNRPPTFQMSSVMHLGIAIKSTCLLDLERIIRARVPA